MHTFAQLKSELISVPSLIRAQIVTSTIRGPKILLRLNRLIFLPSIPIALSFVFSAIIGLSDAYLAANLGTANLAAMGFCEPLWFMMTLLTGGMCSGITVGVGSRVDGVKQNLQSFIVDSLVLSGLLGSLLISFGLLVSHLLRLHPHALSETAPLVSNYFQWCALSNLTFCLMQAQCAIFRAVGRTNYVLILWGIAAATEILFSYFAMHACAYGSNAAPGLEVFAWGWNLGCCFSSMVGLVFLVPLMRGWCIAGYMQQRRTTFAAAFLEIFKIGMPVAAGELGVICSGLINLQVLSMLPDANAFEAAWAIKTRVEDALLTVPVCAVGMIFTSFVARHVGRKSLRRASWAVSIALQAMILLCLALMLTAVLVALVSSAMVDHLDHSRALVSCTARILSMSSMSWPLFALSTLCCAAMEGAGKTLLPAALSIAFILPVRILVIYILKTSCLVSGSDVVTVASAASYTMLALSLIWLSRCELLKLTSRRPTT